MTIDNTTSLIIVLKSTTDLERDGRFIRFSNNFNLNTIRDLIAEKLSIIGSTADIQLWNSDGKLIETLDEIKSQEVVYVDHKQKIKDIIPSPPRLPFVGNLYEMLPNLFEGWMRQFENLGPLVKVDFLGRTFVGTNSPVYAEIFAKESEYFTKKAGATSLKEIKEFARQGLFTTDTEDIDWKLAHKLLIPSFSPRAIYQKDMGELTQQTIRILEQFEPEEPVEILDWTTNLTFQTIGRIGFGYDFNLLSSRDQPPNDFIEAMSYCLKLSVQRFQQAQFIKSLPIEANRKFDRCVKLMHDTVDSVIAKRKASPNAKDMERDLLGYMLNARDENQLGLSDENIRDQVVTFLIAGHDTTANTIAWAIYELSRNPDIQAKVLQEIADNHITHTEIPSSKQISNLKYMHQVLKEVLRMYPPIRSLGRYCKQDCILPGGYRLQKGTSVSIQVYSLHHNEDIYPNHTRFDPDRWTPEEEQKRSRSAWLPFSTGPRGCIGMSFALQEAKTVLAMLLHRFDFLHNGPPIRYDPKMATMKPLDFFVNIHPRVNFPEPSSSSNNVSDSKKPKAETDAAAVMPVLAASCNQIDLPPITFLYGTQTSTAQDYANQLANQAKNFGFGKVTLCEMDSWKILKQDRLVSESNSKHLDKELVVICTATYNGQPPDSAEKFDRWIDAKVKEDNHSRLLNGFSFAVFGLGNKNWRTYQHFPIKVTNHLEELGADRFFSNGEGNADTDMDAQFSEWCAHFWTYTLDSYGIKASESKPILPAFASAIANHKSVVEVKFIEPSNKEALQAAEINYYGEPKAVLHTNRELQKEGSPRSTRHLEIDISQLAPVGDKGLLYNPGDHLEIMPENEPITVEAIALNFGWNLDSAFEINQETISSVSPRSLANNIKGSCSIRNMLTYYADISSPPSRAVLSCFSSQLKVVAPDTAAAFEALLIPEYDHQDPYSEFVKKHRTLLDLQKAYPQVNTLDLSQFLASVLVIQPRRYSIACSPLVYPRSAHLAVSVVDELVNDKHYKGLASSFLRRSYNGTMLRASLKSSKSTFNMPSDPSIPLIMISAGTGLSPFRGFLQQRKAQINTGKKVGETILFFGCRNKDEDYIYQEELEQYVADNVLTELHVAFSRNCEQSPIRYVQHSITANAAKIWSLVCPLDTHTKPATIYICGSGNMNRDVHLAFCNMAISVGMADNDKEAKQFIDKLAKDKRYMCDVWG
ncbi:hypothetical protein A0J61_00693 [Choanephora cucurbitarum]|uniref:NADPH--hemoprotein reductase n=1 Tax=Choanephora cucurbitarum TaxID=101091 RepID=A0A1C7NQF4_9FUNG|nr:hypothetical protein A0J61_00693 [Choanephora cucurbitarum]